MVGLNWGDIFGNSTREDWEGRTGLFEHGAMETAAYPVSGEWREHGEEKQVDLDQI